MGWKRRAAIGAAGLFGVGVLGLGVYVGWALATADTRLSFPDTPYPDVTASTDPAVIEQGRYLVHGPAHCFQCHTHVDDPSLARTAPMTGDYEFAMEPLAITWSRNITSDPETGIGSQTDAEIGRVLRTGVMSDGNLSIMMRFSAARLSDPDLVAVISYLRTVEPVKHEVPKGEWRLIGKLMLPLIGGAFVPRDEPVPAAAPASEEPSVDRGRYLAESVIGCVPCHSPYDMSTYEPMEPKGGGSVGPNEKEPTMEFAPPNLTSHPTGITGKLDEDQFVARMLAGRTFEASVMPWEGIGATTDADLRSIYRYLRTLPPVDHDNGPTYRPVGWTPESAAATGG